MGCHHEDNGGRLVITDVILVCAAKMCLVAEVLMVHENGVVICMHLWCVDPPWHMFSMDT